MPIASYLPTVSPDKVPDCALKARSPLVGQAVLIKNHALFLGL